jgi:hypothetical protein
MGSYKKKEGVIKNLNGYIVPTITTNEKGKVLSVGMVDGQKYFTYNKLESGLDRKNRFFDESMHKSWGGFNYYLQDMACLIKNGQIYIEYVKPVEEVKEVINNQMSMF